MKNVLWDPAPDPIIYAKIGNSFKINSHKCKRLHGIFFYLSTVSKDKSIIRKNS